MNLRVTRSDNWMLVREVADAFLEWGKPAEALALYERLIDHSAVPNALRRSIIQAAIPAAERSGDVRKAADWRVLLAQ
ncbi:MAG: hypothetical protein LR015_09315 [Verrucomicrobia bacterium]|nr:hypothetical protein [Verrucomicrobiota bacterium]